MTLAKPSSLVNVFPSTKAIQAPCSILLLFPEEGIQLVVKVINYLAQLSFGQNDDLT